MSDDFSADGFRLGTAPTDDDVNRANWIIDRQSARIEELEAKLAKAVEALESIAFNTCCDRCQEAALWAGAALAELKDQE